ncbi:prephenate dehydrogenase (NADP(+)) [Ranunculus cassubicifolius]
MASFQLCNSPTNLHHNKQSPKNTLPSSKITNISSTFTRNLSNSRIYTIKPRHFQIISHLGKSLEPSINSPRENPLRIGIIGLGAFGQFLAKAFQKQGHNVLGTSRSDYSGYCQEHGIEFFQHLDDLCEAQPDVLLVCSSIISTEDVVRGIPFNKLKPDTIIADVLSVKQFAKNLLLDVVPSGFGVLCTHPMFGKYSGKSSWEGLRFVYEKVRILSTHKGKCEQFLDIFRDEGCRMIEMSCEEHDEYAAESQFVTHTVARILSNMNLEATPIDTKGYETLRDLTQNTVSHGSDLYDGLFLYNMNSGKQIQKLEKAFDTVKQNLFAKLRDSFARQMEDTEVMEETVGSIQTTRFLPSSEKVLTDVSSFSMVPEIGYRYPCVESKNEICQTA